jgi:hypothetical protein
MLALNFPKGRGVVFKKYLVEVSVDVFRNSLADES